MVTKNAAPYPTMSRTMSVTEQSHSYILGIDIPQEWRGRKASPQPLCDFCWNCRDEKVPLLRPTVLWKETGHEAVEDGRTRGDLRPVSRVWCEPGVVWHMPESQHVEAEGAVQAHLQPQSKWEASLGYKNKTNTKALKS